MCGEPSVAARGWRESNSRPTARQADALPLSHTPKGVKGGVRGARILVSRASTGRLDRLSYHPTMSVLPINHPRFRRGAGRNRTVLEQGCNLLPEPLGHGAANTSPRAHQLQFPLSRRRRASRAVSPARSPTADRARSSPAPARLAALCESSPAAPGFTRIAHRGLEPRISPTWEGLQNNEGDPRVALIAAPGVSNRVRSLTAVLRRGVAQHRPRSSMQPPRCIHIRRAIDRFVADVWLMFSHGSNEKGGPCGPPSTRFLVWA